MLSNNKIDILYEDPDIVAIDKPAGIIVHESGHKETDIKDKESMVLLTDWILDKYPDTKSVGETMLSGGGKEISRPGIVHRLDRDTSGVLLIAKTPAGHACLKEQFQDKTIIKKYLAIVHGVFNERSGIIDLPIGRSSKDFRRFSATRGKRGVTRDAETVWRLLASASGYSILELTPRTGRTHQIRVHMKAINHPILADKLYGIKEEQGFSKKFGLERMALHSFSTTFKNCAGKSVEVRAPLPQDFKNALKALKIEKIAED